MSTTLVVDATRADHFLEPRPSRPNWAGSERHHASSATPIGWLPWTNPNRPATTADEQRFVADLRAAAERRRGSHRRSDLTAVLNGLRGGLTLDELRERAPGLNPARLYDAYVALDDMRKEAVEGWSAIVAEPTLEVLDVYGEAAARLLPVLVARIIHTFDIDPGLVRTTVADAAHGVATSEHLARRIESELDRAGSRTEWALRLGRQLYDPRDECVFGRVDYLPTRVGALVPQRVAKLLEPHAPVAGDDDHHRLGW